MKRNTKNQVIPERLLDQVSKLSKDKGFEFKSFDDTLGYNFENKLLFVSPDSILKTIPVETINTWGTNITFNSTQMYIIDGVNNVIIKTQTDTEEVKILPFYK